MKTIGLIGGMSWESTAIYYQRINTLIKERLGGLHSARLVIYSVDFHEIEVLQRENRWTEAGDMLAQAGSALCAAGADALLICTNTMHKVADAVENASGLPLLHIADVTGEALRKAAISRIALFGTRFTMEQDFYRGRLSERFGIDVLVPDEADRQRIHAIIYDELCVGILSASSRQELIGIIHKMRERGAEGVILGCTELPLLIQAADLPLPVFDTTELHARSAVDFSLQSE